MKKRYIPLLVVAGLFIFFFWQKEESPEITEQNMKAPHLVNMEAEEAEYVPVMKTITKNEIKRFHDSLPHTEDVKLEVRENPHAPPQSLVKFAEKLGPLVEKAKRNPVDADFLVNELGNCVSDESLIVSARSVCLTKAEELAGIYPELDDDVMNIRKQSQEDAMELNQKMNSFDKKKAHSESAPEN